jgi:hypothetical protein
LLRSNEKDTQYRILRKFGCHQKKKESPIISIGPFLQDLNWEFLLLFIKHGNGMNLIQEQN